MMNRVPGRITAMVSSNNDPSALRQSFGTSTSSVRRSALDNSSAHRSAQGPLVIVFQK